MTLKRLYKAFIMSLSLGSLLFTTVAIAESAPSLTAPTTMEDGRVGVEEKTYSKETCPPVEALVLNSVDMKWSAPGGWQSADPAFVRSLRQFIGAQWSGVNVGDVKCLYVKGGRADFPVILHKPAIAISPSGGGWSADKGGYKDCRSADVNECSYEIEKTVQTLKSIYEGLDFYKGQPVQDLD